jgi:hypothetical protein
MIASNVNELRQAETFVNADPGFSYEVIRRSEFLCGSYRGRFDDPEGLLETGDRFSQLIRENPFGDDDDPVQLIAHRGGRVVGRSGLIAGRIQAGFMSVLVYWGSGLRVSPDFRRQGIARKLVKLRMQLHHTVGGCGPARTTTNLYRSLNWIEFRMPRCLLVLKSKSILQRCLGGSCSKYLRPVFDMALVAQRQRIIWRSKRALKIYHIEQVDFFPSSLAADLQTDDPAVSLRSVRSVESINLLLRLGGTACQKCLLVRCDHRVVGYVIVRAAYHENLPGLNLPNFIMGAVKDWRTFDSTKIDEFRLILVGLMALMKMDADVIEATPTQYPTVRQLRSLGMFTKDALKLFLHATEDSPLVARPGFSDPNHWAFTAAEGDNFFL